MDYRGSRFLPVADMIAMAMCFDMFMLTRLVKVSTSPRATCQHMEAYTCNPTTKLYGRSVEHAHKINTARILGDRRQKGGGDWGYTFRVQGCKVFLEPARPLRIGLARMAIAQDSADWSGWASIWGSLLACEKERTGGGSVEVPRFFSRPLSSSIAAFVSAVMRPAASLSLEEWTSVLNL